MSTQRNCKYVFILITFSLLVLLGSKSVYAQAADTTATDSTAHKVKKKETAGRQLNVGVNLVRPAMNFFTPDLFGYEFEWDYYTKNEFYLAGEGGWGGSWVNYTNPLLQYTTKNEFLSFGFNKSLLPRDRPTDWDMMFIGMRVGVAPVKRSPVSYTILDSVWGNTPDTTTKGQNFTAIWAELTGGMRVELFKGLMAGWNFRGRFLLNAKSFDVLAPIYIAGYGRGDKDVAFDFNVYLSYGIRWKRRNTTDTASLAPAIVK